MAGPSATAATRAGPRAAPGAAPGSPVANVLEDFGLTQRLAGARLLEIGPGRYELAEAARAAGAREVVTIDRNPDVVKAGEDLGFRSLPVNPRNIDAELPGLGRFDILVSRGALNAFWFAPGDDRHEPWIAALCSLLEPRGAAWIGPWNAPNPKDEVSEAQARRVLAAQTRGFLEAGFTGWDLPEETATRYGIGGPTVRNRALFVRDLPAPDALRGARRLRAGRRRQPPPEAVAPEAVAPEAVAPEAVAPEAAPVRREPTGNPVVDDFGLAERFEGARVLEIGPVRYELAQAARAAGAREVVTIDRNPDVVKAGADLGFESVLLNPRDIDTELHRLGFFDVLISRGALNAFWFGPEDDRRGRWITALCSLLRPDGAGWIAPWNAPNPKQEPPATHVRRVLAGQVRGFLEAGFNGWDVPEETATRYGIGGPTVRNRALFTRGLSTPETLAGARRLRAPRRAAAPEATPDPEPKPRPAFVRKPLSAAQAAKRRRAAWKRAEETPKAATPPAPFEYHTGLIDMLAAHPDVFHVFTYAEMPWEGDFDHQGFYPDEWERWTQRTREAGDERIHVLLQHDVDSYPELSNALVEYEIAANVPSNVMIFTRAHERRFLQSERRIVLKDYGVDLGLLEHAEREHGFVVGYHTNCVEQALWDLEAAKAVFEADVATLRGRFDLRYFSPHGGVAGPDGLNNWMMTVPLSLARDVRWVHNKYSPRFHGSYSDGRFATSAPGDIRDFVRTWRPGGRYRILTHPQYYGVRTASRDYDAPWYQELVEAHAAGRTDFWSGVWPEALG